MTKNILIINPDMSEAKSIKNRPVSSTTNAVCTYTIDDALAAFNMMDFCLVILDASMSASDDHNLLKAMRNSHTMPILVLSSHADSAEKIHAFNAGAHAYMGMPYTDDRIERGIFDKRNKVKMFANWICNISAADIGFDIDLTDDEWRKKFTNRLNEMCGATGIFNNPFFTTVYCVSVKATGKDIFEVMVWRQDKYSSGIKLVFDIIK